MQHTTNDTLEMQYGKQCVVQVNNLGLNTWTRRLENRNNIFFFQSPRGTRWIHGVNTWRPADVVQRYMRDTYF